MAQSNYNIPNDSAPAVRAQLNDVFQSVATNNSGPTAPTTTFAHQWWYDTDQDILYKRNDTNSNWIPIFVFNQEDITFTSFGFSHRIGQPFSVWDHLSGAQIPNNDGVVKFVKLTAGQSGSGGFNEGLITNESVSGSAPLIQATAQIAIGPMTGQTIPLVNTEQSFIRPGTSSGTLQFDQMQRITGLIRSTSSFGLFQTIDSLSETDGALSLGGDKSQTRGGNTNPNSASNDLILDSADSPNARVSSTTSGETRPKNRQATYYMRIV